MKKVFQTIYGLTMIILFIIVCGLIENEKIGWALICGIIECILALFCSKVFPEKKEEIEL